MCENACKLRLGSVKSFEIDYSISCFSGEIATQKYDWNLVSVYTCGYDRSS